METPKVFKVVYIAECGDELEMYNCNVPHFTFLCEDCNERHKYYAEYLEHFSWDWLPLDNA